MPKCQIQAWRRKKREEWGNFAKDLNGPVILAYRNILEEVRLGLAVNQYLQLLDPPTSGIWCVKWARTSKTGWFRGCLTFRTSTVASKDVSENFSMVTVESAEFREVDAISVEGFGKSINWPCTKVRWGARKAGIICNTYSLNYFASDGGEKDWVGSFQWSCHFGKSGHQAHIVP